jgi:FkbM family methyltransferase
MQLQSALTNSRKVTKAGRRLVREVGNIYRTAGTGPAARFAGAIVRNVRQVVGTGNLAAADRAMAPGRYAFQVGGRTVLVDGSAFAGARELYGRGVYFAPPGFHLRPTDVVLDLGANVGLFSVAAGVLTRRVVAVEAQSGFVEEIRRNAAMNGCTDKVAIEHGLLGPGKGVFADPDRLRTASHYGTTPPTITIPDLLAKHGIDRIGFLKCDIEGAEFGVFRRGDDWLSKVDRVAMEVHPDFGDPEELASVMREHGLRVHFSNNDLETVSRLTETGYLFASR